MSKLHVFLSRLFGSKTNPAKGGKAETLTSEVLSIREQRALTRTLRAEIRWKAIISDLNWLRRVHPNARPEALINILEDNWLLYNKDREDLLDYLTVTSSD